MHIKGAKNKIGQNTGLLQKTSESESLSESRNPNNTVLFLYPCLHSLRKYILGNTNRTNFKKWTCSKNMSSISYI